MNITCQDCGAARQDVAYKNTRYCESCRLLRNLLFIGERTYQCAECTNDFAPIARGDRWCGHCALGSNRKGECVLCSSASSERLRPSISVCKACARDPKQRVRLVKGLRKGQTDRKT